MKKVFKIKFSICGFENLKEVELIEIDSVFMKLKNNEAERPTFTLINPFSIREYNFDIPPSIKALLNIEDDTKILIYNIMVVESNIENSTVNFLAPLVFNLDNQEMAQVILDGNRYNQYGLVEKISNYLN